MDISVTQLINHFWWASPTFFPDHDFHVHYPVNGDDQHLLAHALASDFSGSWQFSQRELHTLQSINHLIYNKINQPSDE
jgi:hypothetical protein